MSSTKIINRITLFKIPAVDDQQKLLAVYKGLPNNAKKVATHVLVPANLLPWNSTVIQDGKPYILSVTAGPAFEDQRNQGYTVAIFSTFASKEDMLYYDTECAAHMALKQVAKPLHQGVLMAYFESIFA